MFTDQLLSGDNPNELEVIENNIIVYVNALDINKIANYNGLFPVVYIINCSVLYKRKKRLIIKDITKSNKFQIKIKNQKENKKLVRYLEDLKENHQYCMNNQSLFDNNGYLKKNESCIIS